MPPICLLAATVLLMAALRGAAGADRITVTAPPAGQDESVSRTAAESDDGDTGAAAPFNPFNPPADLIDPDLEHLRGDIGIRPGRGCADGRCGK